MDTYTKEIDDIVEKAASGCASPIYILASEIDALISVIEMIVLPKDTDGYTAPVMAKHIRKHIRKVGNIDKSIGRKRELGKLYWASRTRKFNKLINNQINNLNIGEQESRIAFAQLTVSISKMRTHLTDEQRVIISNLILSSP